MLLLFETAAGYALFKVLKEKKIEEAGVSAINTLIACDAVTAINGGGSFGMCRTLVRILRLLSRPRRCV